MTQRNSLKHLSYSPVAGCNVRHKLLPLYVSRWDIVSSYRWFQFFLAKQLLGIKHETRWKQLHALLLLCSPAHGDAGRAALPSVMSVIVPAFHHLHVHLLQLNSQWDQRSAGGITDEGEELPFGTSRGVSSQ